MMYMIVLSVIAAALALYYMLFKDLRLFTKHNIPHIRPVPLLGNIGASLLGMQSLAALIKDVYDVHPEAKYVGMYELTKPVVVLRDRELIKSLALKNFEFFPNHHVFVQKDQDPLFPNNLFSLQDDRWREVRSMLSPAFTSSKIKGMFKLMSECATDFGKFMTELPPEKRVMEMKDIFTRYTNDVIATCAFGVSVDSMRNPKNLLYVYGREITSFDNVIMMKLFIFKSLPWLAKIIKLKLFRRKITEYFQKLVETTVKARDQQGIVRPDMLQLLMESRGKKEGRKDLSIMEMASLQLFSFFFGGFDSTSSLMCFAAHEIAVNQDVQKRLQDEIDQVLENTNDESLYDMINNMEYMDAVIYEALRMYPVAVMLDRICKKDFELPPTLPGVKPYIVKKGHAIVVPVYGLHHDPNYFKEAEKFNPERFLGEQKKRTLNTGAYLPFGLGPRMCIAYKFALLETKVLFFHLLARCDLLPCDKTQIPLKIAADGFNMKAEGDFWLKVVTREKPHRTVAVNSVNGTQKL